MLLVEKYWFHSFFCISIPKSFMFSYYAGYLLLGSATFLFMSNSLLNTGLVSAINMTLGHKHKEPPGGT